MSKYENGRKWVIWKIKDLLWVKTALPEPDGEERMFEFPILLWMVVHMHEDLAVSSYEIKEDS